MPGNLRPDAYALVSKVTRMLCIDGDMDVAAFFLPAYEGCWIRVCMYRSELHRSKKPDVNTAREFVRKTGMTILGKGFTGEVLNGASQATTISIEDMYGSNSDSWLHDLLRGHSEKAHLIGAPIQSTFRKPDEGPYGGIVCMRKASKDCFQEEDVTSIRSFATHVSYIVDTDIRYRNQQRRKDAKLKVSHIWQRDLPFQKKCHDSLKIIQEECIFPRVLLSLVNEERSKICGITAAGFLDDLVHDTARSLYKEEPIPKESEDILSRVVRKRVCESFTVDPSKKEDEWALHLHKSTLTRHHVTNLLRVVPLVANGDQIIGVLLAEHPPSKIAVTDEDNKYFEEWAEQLTAMIRIEMDRIKIADALSAVDSVHRTLDSQFLSQSGDADTVLREFVTQVSKLVGFNHAVLYSRDDANSLLVGRVGINVNEIALKRALYDDRPSELSGEHRPSIARRTVLSGSFEFAADVGDKELVHQSDRELLGIPSIGEAVGIPLKVGGTSIGALVGFGPSVIKPAKAKRSDIERIASIAAKSIIFERTLKEHERHRKQAVAEAVIIEQVGRLATLAPVDRAEQLGEIVRVERNKLELILRDAAHVFGADDVKLYVPEEVVVAPVLSGDPEGTRGEIAFAMQERSFYLCCAAGKSQIESNEKITERSDKYNAKMISLTATVLQSLRPQQCDNVEASRYWSKKKDGMQGTLRAWMGIPVLVVDDSEMRVYGVLSFTKFRTSLRDHRVFTKSDIGVAMSMSELLALALRNRQSLREAQDNAKRMLNWFRHDVPARIQSLGQHAEAAIAKLDDKAETASRLEIMRRTSEFLSRCFSAYAALVDRDAKWSSGDANIEEIYDSARTFARPGFPRNDIEIHLTIDDQARTIGDVDAGHLFYILFATISNAAESFAGYQEWPNQDTRPSISVEVERKANCMSFTIRDNGCGIPKRELQSVWKAGISLRRSSGLGLAIVKRLVELNGGRVEPIESKEGIGTVVRFSIRCSGVIAK